MAPTTMTQTAPDDVRKALQDSLPSFYSFKAADPVLQQTLLQAAQAVQVLTMGVPDVLAGGSGLKGAKASGWRVAVSNNGTSLAGDIYTIPRGGENALLNGAPRLACVRQGPEIDAMLQAITALSTPPLAKQLPAEPLSVSLLVMPGLFTEALWLQPQNAGSTTSLVVPFRTLVGGVQLNYAYTEHEIIALLRPTAEAWLSYQPEPSSAASGRR